LRPEIINTLTTTTANTDIFDKKLDLVTEGIQGQTCRLLKSRIRNKTNTKSIVDFILALKTEANISDSYKETLIKIIGHLSLLSADKPFKEMARDEVLAFLDRLRKPEASDPLHKWIGTYNLNVVVLIRFFKWLFNPNLEQRKRPKPSVVENISKLKRKEQSIYKSSDMWTVQDDLMFLKYCPSVRDRCYHTMARDLSCRPSEILRLKIRDVAFKSAGNSQYADVVVNGKTGTRPLPLIDSIPYIKDWLDEHPQRGNPNAYLIVSRNRKNFGRKISSKGLNTLYNRTYRDSYFPRLLQDPNVPPEDKQKIAELLKKPWCPYIRRHSALTEKSTILKDLPFKQHAGWSPRSQMHLRYVHYFGNESSESLLETRGIITTNKNLLVEGMKSKQCPNCSEPNKPDSKFCAKCKMVLTYDAYNETLQGQKEKEDRLSALEKQMMSLVNVLGNIEGQGKNEFAKCLFESGIYKKE